MKAVVYGLLALAMVTLVSTDPICFEPESESQVLLTLRVIDVYIAVDYNLGKIYFNSSDQSWTLLDLNTNTSYFGDASGNCQMVNAIPEAFNQCLPDDATYVHTIEDHDLYYVWRPNGFDWLVAITKVEGSDYYQRFFSRYSSNGALVDLGVTYQSSVGVSDPSVFDRNTTGCIQYFG